MPMTAILALAGGIAARLPRPRQVNAPAPGPDPGVEIARLKEELAAARLQVDVMRLAMMEPRGEIVDCTGGGRYRYLAQQQQLMQQRNAQQPDMWAQAMQHSQASRSPSNAQALNAFGQNIAEGE